MGQLISRSGLVRALADTQDWYIYMCSRFFYKLEQADKVYRVMISITANNETIDPNSLMWSTLFCLLLERDK